MPDRSDPLLTLSITLGDDTFTCTGPKQTVAAFLDRWLIARGGQGQGAEQALQDAAAKIRQGAVQVDNATSTIDQLGHEGG